MPGGFTIVQSKSKFLFADNVTSVAAAQAAVISVMQHVYDRAQAHGTCYWSGNNFVMYSRIPTAVKFDARGVTIYSGVGFTMKSMLPTSTLRLVVDKGCERPVTAYPIPNGTR